MLLSPTRLNFAVQVCVPILSRFGIKLKGERPTLSRLHHFHQIRLASDGQIDLWMVRHIMGFLAQRVSLARQQAQFKYLLPQARVGPLGFDGDGAEARL